MLENKGNYAIDFTADFDLRACSNSPVFKKVIIHLNQKYYKGKTLVIEAPKASDRNIYVKSVKLNGQSYDKSYIIHNDIENGGLIEFNMSDRH